MKFDIFKYFSFVTLEERNKLSEKKRKIIYFTLKKNNQNLEN